MTSIDPSTDGAAQEAGAVTPEVLEALATASPGNEGSTDGEQVSRPTKLIRIASMVRALLDEARLAPLDDALRLANDSRYGLQAAIFTADLSDALKAARTLDYGGVLVNEVPTFRADQQPYGGNRDSGNTREGPQWAVREMTEERLIIIQT